MKLLYVILLMVLSGCVERQIVGERVYLGEKKVEDFDISLRVLVNKKGDISNVFIQGLFFYIPDMDDRLLFVEVEELKKQSHGNYTFITIFGGPGKALPLECKLDSVNINSSSLQLKLFSSTMGEFDQENGYTFNCRRQL